MPNVRRDKSLRFSRPSSSHEKEIWISSHHAVREMLHSKQRIDALAVDLRRKTAYAHLIALAEKQGVRVEILDPQAYREHLARNRIHIDSLHQGLVAHLPQYTYCSLEELIEPKPTRQGRQVILALDQITDPHNLGAIIRSSVAFGSPYIIVTKDRSAVVNETSARASAGAIAHAQIAREVNLVRALKTLKALNYLVIGLDSEAPTNLADIDDFRPIALVVGSEGSGMRRLVGEACDILAHIPMGGPVQSLNASVAAAIGLYILRKECTR